MSDSVKYLIGSKVSCTDAPCGRLALVVVDPVAAKLVHLIVVPVHGVQSRLVSVDLVSVDTARPADGEIKLGCTLAEFNGMDEAVKTHFMPAKDPEERWGYADDEIVSWPFFGLGPSPPKLGLAAPEPVMMPDMAYEDRVPAGEVRIHRGEHVHAADGDIGRIQGLVVDPADEAVTHVLLDEGHLWSHRQVAIPMAQIEVIDADGVSVRLTKDQVKGLPPVEIVGLA